MSAHQVIRVWEAPARYPSTIESGRFSLLCETSLTRCPPKPSLDLHGSTLDLERAG
ncbi:hypothetical protein CCACVL1_21526 [Corchorus capsularis]|uniref:Uncharacterized protein n=1 Tax=Corchorus capsularis TaxID=210143 RepID=A0A1R3H503_COCAP|nr:hypothetical protein CCACVL1_21526 [Corchorus capsularis]